jgi:LPXTG-site transpeptidase (sortase) family protein
MVLAIFLGWGAPVRRAGAAGPLRPSHQIPFPWWDSSYQYARQLTVTTGANAPLNRYAGYSVRLQLDTSDPARFRGDCSDLRLVYWDGSTNIELDRAVYACGSPSTQVWFRLQADIADSSSDASYVVYYGNPLAGAPPADLNRVYLWWDDFSTDPFAAGSPRYSRTKAVDIHGDAYVAPAYDAGSQRVAFNTGDNFTSDMYINTAGFSNGEQDIFIQVDHFADLSYPTNATDAVVVRVDVLATTSTHEYVHFSHGSYSPSPACTIDSWTNGERNSLCGGIAPAVYWPFSIPETWALASTDTLIRFWRDAGALYASPDPTGRTLLLGTSLLSTPQSGYVGLAPAQSRGWWDNLLVRRYTEPEPTLTPGVEHPYAAPLITDPKSDSLYADNDGSGVPSAGDALQYTITVENNGGSAATDVVFGDTPGADTSLVVGSVTTTQGIITSGNSPGDTSVSIDIGLLAPGDVVLITFRVTVDDPLPPGVDSVANQGLTSGGNFPSRPTDDPATSDPDDPTQTALSIPAPELPATGFAPGVITQVEPRPPAETAPRLASLRLVIPDLGLDVPIVAVPLYDGQWELSWLGEQAGHLEGTAFPTWPGNSVLTGHVYLANGQPGPFFGLEQLRWDDEIVLRAFGLRYVYRVRQALRVSPGDLSVLAHEELAWLTLITCQGYNPSQGTYAWRWVTRAVLVEVSPDEGDG